MLQGGSALLLLWMRGHTQTGWLDALLLILAVVDLATIPPAFVVLRQRMREIQRGELEEARRY